MATINFFSDLPLDFTPHPVSGDVRPVTNDVAIKRSISNLIRTKKGSKPFYPEYGTNMDAFLFSNQDVFTAHNMKESLATAINTFEKRVSVIEIKPEFSDNGVKLTITYRIKNTNSVSSLTTTIKRTA